MLSGEETREKEVTESPMEGLVIDWKPESSRSTIGMIADGIKVAVCCEGD